MFILVGVQLIIYWVLMRVLEELSQRDNLARTRYGWRLKEGDPGWRI